MSWSVNFCCLAVMLTLSIMTLGCDGTTKTSEDKSKAKPAATQGGATGSDKQAATDKAGGAAVASGENDFTADPAADKAAADKAAADKAAADKAAADKAAADKAAADKAAEEMAAADKAADATATEKVVPGDWEMWGGSHTRNMASTATGISLDFDIKANTNVKWVASLGTQTYGNPVISNGKVYVGTNNGAEYRENHQGDRGIVLCFNEADGKFLWQLTREKLEIGQVMDWPEQGICSSPYVEGNRLWVVTNRCELMCLDTEGFLDGKNDGDYQDEVDSTEADADVIWSLDMIDQLGVFPHNLATSSPIVHGDLVFIVTSNGVDEAHLELPSPRAPSFIAVNKNTGEVVWENGAPEDRILHGQWSSPAIGEVNGETLVFFPGGDGICYALRASDGEIIWTFDLNPKETKWELGGLGSRNNIIGTPVFFENSVLLAVGQDPEHGEGTGHFYRIDATKTGDISPELGPINQPGTPNPASGVIWHYGGVDDEAGTVTGTPGESIFRRTLSTCAIHDGVIYLSDLSGYLHCVDLATGKRYWVHDTKSAIWGSPMYADGKVFLGTEDGRLIVFKATKEKAEVIKEFDTVSYSSVYSTPVFSNGNMYLTDRTRLYCIPVQ